MKTTKRMGRDEKANLVAGIAQADETLTNPKSTDDERWWATRGKDEMIRELELRG